MEHQNKAIEARNSALQAGLLRKLDSPTAYLQKSIYIPFGRLGVPVLSSPVFMPVDFDLDGDRAIIKAIEIIDDTTLDSTPDGTSDNLAASIYANGMFTFVNANNEIICSVPLPILIKRLNRGKQCLFNMDRHLWQNCYIEFYNVAALSTSNAITLQVYYHSKF